MSQEKMIDKVNGIGVITGVAMWLIMIVYFGLNWGRLPEELPLFYSLPRGEQQLIDRSWFMIVLLVAGLVFGVNLFLAYWFGKQEILLKRFLIWGGVLGLTLLLMSFGRIMIIIL